MEYSISKPSENPFEAEIEKKGLVVHFTLRELRQNTEYHAKLLKEQLGQIELDSAKMKNIEDHHPFVLTMSAEDLFTAALYQQSKTIVDKAKENVDKIEKQMASDAQETEEILKQLPELAKAIPKVEATDKK